MSRDRVQPQVVGKEVDYDLPDEDWFKAGLMIMGEDCTGKLDVSMIKYVPIYTPQKVGNQVHYIVAG